MKYQIIIGMILILLLIILFITFKENYEKKDEIPIIIYTRMSIKDKNTIVFNKKDDIHNNDRLNYRMKIFNDHVLPNMMKQKYDNWKWKIYTSNVLPNSHMKYLKELEKNNNKIEIIPVKHMGQFNEFVNDDIKNFKKMKKDFVSVRLDDDDFLYKNYFNFINKNYKNKKLKKFVSLKNGYKYEINDKNNLEIKEDNYPCVAAGLGQLNGNIYKAGKHTDICKNYKVLEDPKRGYYINVSEYNDSNRQFKI
jgi:hypothetical protein